MLTRKEIQKREIFVQKKALVLYMRYRVAKVAISTFYRN